MLKSLFWRSAMLFSLLSVFSTNSYAQLSAPNGTVSNSNNNNIGIGTTNPTSRLQVESNASTGLLQLNFSESQGAGGDESGGGGGGSSTVSPAYAFKLVNTPYSLSSYTSFLINGTGETYIGNIPTITSPATLNVKTDLNIAHDNNNYLQFYYSGLNNSGLTWTSTSSSKFTITADASNSSPIDVMTLLSNGQVGIGTNTFNGAEKLRVNGTIATEGVSATNFLAVNTTSPRGLLHLLKSDVSNEGELGQNHGIVLENNGWRGHDYALEVITGHGSIFTVANSGHIFIGSGLNLESPNPTDYRLYVEKGIRTEYLRIDIANESGWADFVFKEGYDLMPLSKVESFINENDHLPGVPSAKSVVENGIDVGEMNKILLKNVEELTLRLIQMQKEIDSLKAQQN